MKCLLRSVKSLLAISMTTCLLSLAILAPRWAYTQASAIDLGFCMNGSGSISAADFSLQKAGIQAALGNPQLFPRNGSMGFTLVQYASNTTIVHIPYTVISSEAVAQTLISQVNSITQLQGCTNPGSGINVAMAQINANGSNANQKIICLFTDGLPNCGASTPAAVANAKANGLDRFSVVAIEDPPINCSVCEPDFQSYYGPLVFGGGAVTVAKNTVEFANFVGTTCLFPSVELIGLEVNQAVQNWVNSVDLVEHKTTYVRAHLKSLDMNPVPAQVRLRAKKNGVELGGSPLTALNAANFNAQVMPDRGNWNHSINFQVPDSWTTGTIELTIEAIGGGLTCKEAAGPTAEDCKTTVSFLATDVPEVRYVRVRWDDGMGNTYQPTNAQIAELDQRLEAIYPVSDVSTSSSTLSWTGTVPPDVCEVNEEITWMRFLDFCFSFFGCDRIYYGVLKGPMDGGGVAVDIPSSVSCGYMPDAPLVYGRNRHAHELGHNLNRHHTRQSSGTGFCGENSGNNAPTFPYSATVGGMLVAPIGPDVNDAASNQAMYGLDDHLLSQGNITNGVIAPTEHFDLMSYCGTWRWISDFTYEGIRGRINSVFKASSQNMAAPEYLVIRGLVNFNTNVASFKPFLKLESSALPSMPSGNYNLVLKGAGGNVLSTIPFEPAEIHADFPAVDPGAGLFIIPVPYDPNIKQAEVVFGGNVIGSITASDNAPVVTVTYPNGGEFLSGNDVNIQWSGSDPDNDPLTYVVQFSKDGGANWETLVTDYPNQSLLFPLADLAATSQGRIRVYVSDGFNSAYDDSDGLFTTPNNPPDLTLLTPTNNAVFVGVQPVFFQASVSDKEQGSLSGNSIVWTSNKNGVLGTGTSFNLTADQLAEGIHTITAKATDGGGLTDQASVSIQIVRIGAAPCVPPTVTINGDLTLCYGQPNILTASGGTTYSWSNGSSTASTSVSTPGTYTVTATSTPGCTASATATVIIDPLPIQIACPQSVPNLTANASCQAMLGDYTGSGLPAGGCAGVLNMVMQTPPPGTIVNPGTVAVSLEITNSLGESAKCIFNVKIDGNCH